MTAQTSPVQTLERQRTTPAFRAVRWLVGAYLILSMLTVAAIIILSGIAPDLVTPQASVRGIIVAATSVLTFVFASRGRAPLCSLKTGTPVRRPALSIGLVAVRIGGGRPARDRRGRGREERYA